MNRAETLHTFGDPDDYLKGEQSPVDGWIEPEVTINDAEGCGCRPDVWLRFIIKRLTEGGDDDDTEGVNYDPDEHYQKGGW